MITFSIVIATYNAELYLAGAIESIIHQTYSEWELIVIDGNSTDGTNRIIGEYMDCISYYKSESDRGIYDAWNKGVSIAKGDWILFIGADDVLLPNALESYYKALCITPNNEYDFVSGRVDYVDTSLNHLRFIGQQWQWPLFLKKMTVSHVGSLHNRRLFKEVGTYDISYKIIGDYELLLRKRGQLKALYVDSVFAKMREGGVSLSSKAIQESIRAQIYTGGRNAFCAWLEYFLLVAKLKKKKKKNRL